jgi:hypothetical protein
MSLVVGCCASGESRGDAAPPGLQIATRARARSNRKARAKHDPCVSPKHSHHPTHTHTHVANMSSIRPPAEEGALVEALGEAAKHRGVQLGVGPWRDVADLPTVRLGTCFAWRRRGQRGHAARRGEARRGGCSGCTRGHLGHLSLPFPAHLSVTAQKGWATRRAKAAAAQAELEAPSSPTPAPASPGS